MVQNTWSAFGLDLKLYRIGPPSDFELAEAVVLDSAFASLLYLFMSRKNLREQREKKAHFAHIK